jgi:hypothetical protein
LCFELPIRDQRADTLCDAVLVGVDPKAPAFVENL